MVCMSGNMRLPDLTRGTARPGAASRRAGYLIAVLVNVVLLWLVIGWPSWQVVPFLTDQMQEVIVLVVFSLLVGAASNLVNFAVDRAWVKALGAIITSAIGLAALVRLWEVFPFDFGGSNVDWVLVTRVVLAVAIAGCVVGIIVQIVTLVRAVFRTTSGSRRESDRQVPGSGAAPPNGQERKDARNRRL